MENKILEVCKVTPPQDSPTEMYLPLTFFDLQSVGSPVDHLLFYPHPLFSSSTLVHTLKQSLSLTLKHFLPFAGNITWSPSSPKPIFSYEKGDGVFFTVAECNADFYHLSSEKLRESKILHSLVAHIVGSDSGSPLFAVKVTIFPNKGFCIGFTNHCAASDGKAISIFIKTWASFSKFGTSKEVTPVFDRESVRDRYMELENSCIEILGKSKMAFWKSMSQPMDTLRGTFRMSGLQVNELKELVARLQNYNNNGDINQASYVSTFTVTYAYVVLCMVKAKTIANNQVRVIFHYDCRERLAPPLSSNYIGNCVGVCVMNFNKEELLGKDGLMTIVNSISMSIKGLDKNGALRGASEWLPNLIKEISDDEEIMQVFVSGSSKFELHRVDFGWGRPLKADTLENGGITFTEVEDSGGAKGIDVDLCLTKGEMEKFASIFTQGLSKIKKHKHTLAAL